MEQQIEQMLTLQNQMNTKVHAHWVDQGFEWYRAIWIECAELMEHHGWKWWKKQTPDREQVILELVDIWHFGLSDLLQSGQDSKTLVSELKKAFSSAQKPNEFLLGVEGFAGEVLRSRRFLATEFAGLLLAVDLTFDQLYRSYIGKNVLNFFRQDNGYKEGTYAKVWSGREDNEHLFEILHALNSDSPDFADRVYSALQERYSEISASV